MAAVFSHLKEKAQIKKLIKKIDDNLIKMKVFDLSIKGINTRCLDITIFPEIYCIDKDEFRDNLKHYEPDLTFTKRNQCIGGRKIEYSNILPDACGIDRHVMIVGSAGAGKTTITRLLSKQAKLMKSNIKLVIYLEFKQFFKDDLVNLIDVVLGPAICPALGSKIKREGLLQWMISHQNNIIFLMDGYDQLKSPFEDQETIKLDYSSMADARDFLRNIINGQLFKESTYYIFEGEWD